MYQYIDYIWKGLFDRYTIKVVFLCNDETDCYVFVLSFNKYDNFIILREQNFLKFKLSEYMVL